MANNRTQIVKEITRLLSVNLDGDTYTTNIFENAKDRQAFWDEVEDYPSVCVYPGTETREYLPGDFKWAFLTVNIRIFVDSENSKEELEQAFDDIEDIIDSNNNLTVAGNDLSTDLRLLSISDDEGLLSPLGVGEIVLEIRYEV
jgi:hypothetical protein